MMIEKEQLNVDYTENIERKFFIEMIKKKLSEREGILTLPKSLEDAIKKVVQFVEFEPIHKGIIEDMEIGDVKKEFLLDESGAVLTVYMVGGNGVKSYVDADGWYTTVLRQFVLTPKGDLLVLETTKKEIRSDDFDILHRTLNRVKSENQTLSNWERKYLLDNLIREVKIGDCMYQIAEEILNDYRH